MQAEKRKIGPRVGASSFKAHTASYINAINHRYRNICCCCRNKEKRHVDWPQDFSPGMSTNVKYDKLDLAEFVAGYLSMMKTYDPEATKFMLSHLELLMIKGTSYSWSSLPRRRF